MRECKKVEKDKKITLVEVVKNDMVIKEVIEYDSKKKIEWWKRIQMADHG